MTPTARDSKGAVWHTSTYSNNGSGCIERGRLGGGRQGVRDTKDRARGVLTFEAPAWASFVAAAQRGDLTR
ncbi:DUF397 domain-containing protein [Streptomyces sp. RFCAC02]|uniref:DUF397 domain-containing protein n=1 Tax=Streptomyces sp. RFCAC02 TaxID=2499143 RepID=UPI00101F54DC|nr:DUF397 domain-containing protein [Streptomyces sp. RFCAC02]